MANEPFVISVFAVAPEDPGGGRTFMAAYDDIMKNVKENDMGEGVVTLQREEGNMWSMTFSPVFGVGTPDEQPSGNPKPDSEPTASPEPEGPFPVEGSAQPLQEVATDAPTEEPTKE